MVLRRRMLVGWPVLHQPQVPRRLQVPPRPEVWVGHPVVWPR